MTVLALDQGSSSSRTLAFGPDGSILASSQAPVRPQNPKDGWVEYDAQALLDTQRETLEAVVRGLPASEEALTAGIACQRSTVVFWDAKTGKPACPALSWQDRRAADIVAGLSKRAEDIHVRTGLLLNPFYSLGKILWTLENEPKVRRLLDSGRLRLGPVGTWLAWNLTKGEVYAADATLAQRMLLFNIGEMGWDAGLLKLAGLPRPLLPEVRPSAGAWGEAKVLGRKVRFSAMIGDQQAAALGLGVEDRGTTAVNYGTGAFLLHHIGSKPKHVPGLLCSVALEEKGGPGFFLEGTVNAAGTAVDWLRERLGVRAADAELDALYAKAEHPPLVLLAFGGLGAPRWDTKVFSGILGLRPGTGAPDLVRGVLDSVAFLVADVADSMTGAGLELGEVRAAGGLSKVDALLQRQADLFQRRVLRMGLAEATALGAAALAARASGADFEPVRRPEKAFDPRRGAAQARRDKDCWKAFVEGMQGLSRDPRVFEALLEWAEIFPPARPRR